MLKEGLVYRERPDLSIFVEGEMESVFVEIVRGNGQRNDVELTLQHLVGSTDTFDKIVGELRFCNQYIDNFLLVILI